MFRAVFGCPSNSPTWPWHIFCVDGEIPCDTHHGPLKALLVERSFSFIPKNGSGKVHFLLCVHDSAQTVDGHDPESHAGFLDSANGGSP